LGASKELLAGVVGEQFVVADTVGEHFHCLCANSLAAVNAVMNERRGLESRVSSANVRN
jgi:hypothetical protein